MIKIVFKNATIVRLEIYSRLLDRREVVGKFKILIETVTFAYVHPEVDDGKLTRGTGVSHQLLEFDTKDEAEFAFRMVRPAGIAGMYMREVWALYQQ